MYGDTSVMRKRAAQLRDQGADVRATADHLTGQAEQVAWTGRAADAMRERVRDRAAQLRDCASRHEDAADALEQHLQEVDHAVEAITHIERKASSLVADARARIARAASQDDPDGGHRTASEEDRRLASFNPPPPGHRDWLTVELPGL